MTEDLNQPSSDTESEDGTPQADELSILKSRARMMGVTFSNNISVSALKQKIEDKMSGTATEPEAVAPPPLQDPDAPVPARELTFREKHRLENMRLIRLRITNLDPKKKDLQGEVFTVANEYLGTIKKFVPYGEVTEGGYHVPWCIYTALKARKFLNIRTYKDRQNNNNVRIEQSWAQEFALEVLPQLTLAELRQLATAQLAAGSVG